MIPNVFNVYTEIAGDILNTGNISGIEEISVIIHVEPLHHLIYKLPNQGLVCNHKQISNTQFESGN